MILERPLGVAEYRMLRRHVGWGDIADDAALERALAASIYTVCVERDGELVAAGRVVGDTGVYAYVQDVVVLEPYRGQGLARAVMDRIMAFIETTYPPGAFVGLMAASGVEGFYLRYGFQRRPEDGPGMFRYVR